MYRIKVIKLINDQTGTIFYEYGFSKQMMKRIHFLFNETNDGFSVYDILEITVLGKNIKTFKKCLTNKIELL